MSAIHIELPDEVHRRAAELARASGVSLDRFMVAALIEKLSTMVPKVLEDRALRGHWDGFDRFMDGVPDVPAQDPDKPLAESP